MAFLGFTRLGARGLSFCREKVGICMDLDLAWLAP